MILEKYVGQSLETDSGTICPAVDVHVAVKLRTDVFRHSRSRAMKVKPKPVKVFDIVNEVAAAALSSRPLRFPDLVDCLAEHSRLA